MSSLVQPNVFRVFTKVGKASEVAKALQQVGVPSDTVVVDTHAKVIFIADSVDVVRGALKSVGVNTCEVFDVNINGWDSSNPDKYFIKVTL